MKRVRIQIDKDCWFCYDNPKIEKELIISDFSENQSFYVALPKGPISDYHFLIVPKTHIASSIELTPQQTLDYLAQKQKVTQYLDEKSLDFVIFERNM